MPDVEQWLPTPEIRGSNSVNGFYIEHLFIVNGIVKRRKLKSGREWHMFLKINHVFNLSFDFL